ncbi:MAG TPA: DUF4178 domain-containing protein [Oligoflexia bacterium]|nr:DUF4178 domain-containing protein [Oligoflexia bacterium]HMP49302.1 DUF4178 domain-containing protein [Oligoflexia bacterium]
MDFSSQSYQCASCGAPLDLKSGLSVYAVCAYCGAAQIKKGTSLEKLGEVPELLDDMSIIQLGTRGVLSRGPKVGKRFQVVGRIRLKWERATWDEWYVLFEDMSAGWLAESSGFYYVTTEDEMPVDLRNSELSIFELGASIRVGSDQYYLKDKKDAECIYSEGELPFSGAVGEHIESYDFTGSDLRFVTISRTKDIDKKQLSESGWGDKKPDLGPYQLFKGYIFTFPELEFEFMREVAGWEHGALRRRV